MTKQTSLHGQPAEYEGGIHQVAEGCLAYLQPNGGLGEANVGLVCGAHQTLVVDTCWDHIQAKRMLDAAAPWIADKPITTVVNTHSNGDHWWGNALMPADARIIASKACRDSMKRESPIAIAAMTSALGVAARLPLPGLPGRKLRRAHEEFAPFDFWGVKRRYPDETFVGSCNQQIDEHTVDLVEVGPAHTPGDAMVFARESRVVFTGDILFVGPSPIMWDGPASNWTRALQSIIDFDPIAIVPGHGPLASLQDVRDNLAYFQWMESEATRLYQRGVKAMDAARQMLRSDDFASSPWGAWERPETIIAGIKATYRHASKRRFPFTQFEMLATMSQIEALGSEVQDPAQR